MSRWLSVWCIAVAALAAGQLDPVFGQTIIRGSPQCGKCKLHLNRVTEIGGLDTEISETLLVARDSKGRVYVSNEGRATEIRVFSPGGKLLAQVGKPGSGPGEFRFIRGLRIGVADSLHVYDAGQSRITVFDPLLRLIRVVPTQQFVNSPNGWWVTQQGSYVANASIRSRSQSGIPMHLVDAEGRLQKSFGSEAGVFRSDFGHAWMRRAAVVQDGIWGLHLNEYLLEKWDRAGTRKAHIRREARWFEPWWTYPDAELPSPPMSIGLHADSLGRLWTVTLVASANQKKYREVKPGERGSRYATYKDQDRAFDSMIEILDPVVGRLIASGRVAPKLIVDLGNQYYVGYREGPNGVGYMDIWHVTLLSR